MDPKYLKNIPTSDSQLRDILGGKVNILSYDELSNFDNIKQVLGRYNKAIILYLSEDNYGHWTSIKLRKNGRESIIDVFDSYGKYIDDVIEAMPAKYRKKYKQNGQLTELLIDAKRNGFIIDYNDKKRQGDSSVCGLWCALWLILELSNDEFNNFTQKINDDNIYGLFMNDLIADN